jgi:hypothetical protein
MIVDETGADTGEFKGQVTLVRKEGNENLLNKNYQIRVIEQDLNQSGGLLAVSPGDVISLAADAFWSDASTPVAANKQITVLSTDGDIKKLQEEEAQTAAEFESRSPAKPAVKTEIRAQIGNTQLTKNDSGAAAIIEMDVSPKIVSGRAFIPLRFLAEALNAETLWEEETQTVKIRYNEREITVQEGRAIMAAGAAPFIENGRMMVPVRAVFEFFHASVDWDETTGEIWIAI